MEQTLKDQFNHHSVARCSSTFRLLRAFLALFLLPITCYSAPKKAVVSQTQARPAAVSADVPSGFFPGVIHYFAGFGSTTTGTYSDGSLPTQVPLTPLSSVTDSHGNVYIATVQALYMVYAGGTIPAVLANVTTNATPAVTPVSGRIYQIAGFSAPACGACEGMPLNQVVFGGAFGLGLDSQDDLYYADQGYYVVRKVDAATSNVNTVAGTWGTQPASAPISGGPATGTSMTPGDIRLDQWDNLYINDAYDDLVFVVYSGSQPPPVLAAENITVGAGQKNDVYIIAGAYFAFCPGPGMCGDGNPAVNSTMYFQWSIAVDLAGDVYIADAAPDNSGTPYPYIRVIYAGGTVPPLVNLSLNPTGGSTQAPVTGYIYAVTGYSLTQQFTPCAAPGCGDGGLAGSVQFGVGSGTGNLDITVDGTGNLYVSDSYAHALRKLDTSGNASTIAGIDDPTQSPPTTVPVADGGPAVGTYLSYPAYISFDSQNNLYITDTDLLWQVAPLQPQTITFSPLSNVTYGTAPIAMDATASSGLPVQYSISSTPSGIANLNGSQLVITGAGTVHVTASQPGDSTYAAAASVINSFAVAQAPLSVTANPASKVYGSPNPAFTATITGFVNGDTAQTPGVLSGAPSFSTTATTNSPVGTYPITPSLGTLTSANYTFPAANFLAGSLTVTGTVPQTINFAPFSPATVPYGQAPITLSATATSGGPVSFIYVSGPAQLSGPNGSILTINGAGSIVVKAIQNGYQQYAAATPVAQTLHVSPAVLTVTGPTVTVTYGSAIDPTTFPAAAISGFVGADTQGSILTGTAQYTLQSTTPNVGTYPIIVSLGTLTLVAAAAPNYVFATPVNGALIVNEASQTINFNPVPAGQTYGQFITLTAAATSGLPVTFTTTGPSIFYNNLNNILELNGVGTVTVTATQAGTGNYAAAAPVTQTLNVGPAPLQVVAKPLIREQGASNPILTYGIGCPNSTPVPGCFVLNDSDIPSVITGIPDLTTTATDSSPPGTYPIVIHQGTLLAPNYAFVFVNSTLTVSPPGNFAITANPASLTIPRGKSGQSTITITPANNYQGSVTMSCGQMPANVSCVVSPSTFSFPGSQNPDGSENPAQGTITINTAAGTIVGALAAGDLNTSQAGLLLPGAFFGLLLLFLRRRRARWLDAAGVCIFLLLGLGVFSLVSCSGGTSFVTAAPGTITVSINGSGTIPSGSGTVTASVPLTVVIQ
jgi:hypothetical protein